MTYDVLLWLCEKVYLILLNILLVPVAILGLFFDKLRRLLRKCPTKLKWSRQSQEPNQNLNKIKKRTQLQIVIDMDLTLVFCTKERPEHRFFKEGRDYVVVYNEEFGGEIYVYKRPFMYDFLKRVSEIGTISIFTAN